MDHMGSWAVVNEGGEGNGLHNVFTTANVIEHFQRTGEFPDGAVLVKEVFASENAQLTTGSAHWATDPQVWFVMVKDTEGRFSDNPLWGDGWGWALFNAEQPNVQVATDFQTDCKTCHIPAQQTDWIYTYAYPSLKSGREAQLNTPADDVRHASAPDATAAPQTMQAMSDALDEPRLETVAFDESAEAVSVADEADADNGAAQGDPEAGKRSFAICMSCHSVQEGRNGLGPTLAGLVGRAAGTVDGFAYSDALKSSDVVWTAEAIDAYLANSSEFIPGNRMAQLFPAGVRKAETRQDIIAYLATQ